MSAEPVANGADWTIGRLLSWTTEYLSDRGVDDPRLSCEILLSHALGCRRIELYTRFDEVPADPPRKLFRELLKRAADHEPIAYLVGEKEFFSLPLIVTRDVLIPRGETETLVECVLDHCVSSGLTGPRLLDLGVGNGCIIVALLKQLPEATGVASDISPEALEVARRNAERHGVLDRLTLVEADGLALPPGVVPEGGFDVLVSNPPYIQPEAMDGLDANVREYEPRVALTDDRDGCSFYHAIAADGPALLAEGGVVVVEVPDGRADAVTQRFEASGRFVRRVVKKDRVVGQERALLFSLR